MITPDLNIDLLRKFVTVADLGSFTRAARILYRTQPSESIRVKRLEEISASRLLDRSDCTIHMTRGGKP